ncbi:unnamed protein product [Notodromas monacha]|uniref:Protein-tyrosine-phosphatase n=1 Tax=Notodromas monacha TaxID=399045 RepID=A0A7R9BDU8_9CRUS|nr:unnamed protein product [Notodromas monacha]CAG0912629.1 unnamed protein product [Notodromas monacha]
MERLKKSPLVFLYQEPYCSSHSFLTKPFYNTYLKTAYSLCTKSNDVSCRNRTPAPDFKDYGNGADEDHSENPFGKYKPVMTLSGASKVSVTLKIDPPPKDVMEFIGAIADLEFTRHCNLLEYGPCRMLIVARAVHGFSGLAGNASKGVIGATLDAPPSQPQNVAVECFADPEFPVLRVRWDPPKEVGGKIVKYKMKVVMSAIYDDEEGYNQHTVDDLEVQTMGNETRQTVLGTPNTNYSITVTALTQAGPGEWSHRSKESQCFMQPGLPSFIPASKWRPFSESGERRIFMLMPRRVSQRNGPICCYRVVLVRFPGKVGKDAFPDPENVTLRTYEEAHEVENNTYGAYVAEMFGPRELPDVIMLGDELPAPSAKACQLCFSVGAIRRHARSKDSSHPHHHRRERNFYHEALTSPVLDAEDGILSTESTYWGFMEVIVQKPDGHAGVKRSRYFAMDEAPVPGLSAREGPGTSFSTSKLVPIISGILLGVLVVGFLLIGIFFALRNYSKLLAAGQGVEHSFSFSVRHMWASLRGNPEGIPLSQPPPPDRSPIPKSKLVPAFVTRHRDGDAGFRSEFELLPDRFADRTTHSSDDLNNSGKNRYPDIKAYDQTRVTLSKTGTTEEHACSDYINANFVVGFKERKKFICAQGPLLGTVNDFWRMIWEYEVQLMIMLTNFEENRKVKCCHYWPEEGTETYDYVLRRLRAEKGEGESKETREVAHYHYLVWKDFMAPEHPSGVLKFLKRINSVYTPDKGQILIHCSAGVGRTGTLVALDSLLQEMNEEGKASVFNTVSELRHQRNYLVQSLKQYIFVYRGLMEYAQFGDTEVAQGELRENYQRMIQRPSMEFGSGKGISPMQEEFSRLAEAVEDPKPITYATNEQNEEKNRCSAIVPYDQNRVILSPVFSKPDETYINASFIQGYDHSMSFVITQDPLKSTRVDFWRMVLDHNVTTLVMLSECECEADGDEAGLCDDDDERDALTAAADVMCPQYWPDSADEDVTFDHIRVSLAKIDTLPMFIKRTLTVTNVKNGETVTVKQFQYLGWADSEYADPADKTVSAVPESTSGLLELNSQISRTQETSQEVGIVGVHCRFGGDRSSVFVCLCILLQQLRTERAVDVFQTVRNLRSQRPGMIQHLAQYEFLYKALVDYSDKESP